MALTGKQSELVHNALLRGFPSIADLEQIVRFQLDENLDEIAGGTNLSEVVFSLIRWAEARGRTDELIRGAYNANSGNSYIEEIFTQFSNSENTQVSSLSVQPPIFQAIDPPTAFIGRDKELSVIKKELNEEHGLVIIRGGLGGVGKTSLAAYSAQQLRDNFLSGVLWARLDTTDTMSILSSFITAIDSESSSRLKHLTNVETRASYYRTLLLNKQCLIVLDNAENDEQVLHLLPASGSSAVVITTRYSLPKTTERGFELNITDLSLESTAELLFILTDAARNPINISYCKELYEIVGGLPLAIRIVAGIIRESGWSIEDILNRLKESSTLVWLSDVGSDYGLRSSFKISYLNLPSESTQKTFRVLGVFNQLRFPSHAVASICNSSDSNSELELLMLIRRGLVEPDKKTRDNYRIHPLLQEYARELLIQANEEHDMHSSAGYYYRSLLSVWQPDEAHFVYGTAANLEDADNGLIAAHHFFCATQYDLAQDTLIAIADTLSLQGLELELLRFIEMLEQHVQLLPWLQLYHAGIIVEGNGNQPIENGQATLQRLSKSDDLRIASAALIGLASVEANANNHSEAKRLLVESADLKSLMNPVDDKGRAYILNELARIEHQTGGSAQVCLGLHNQALSVQESICDYKGQSYTLRKVASIHLYHFGEINKASDLLGRSKKLAIKVGDQVGLVHILMEEAEVQRRQHYFQRAADILDEAYTLAAKYNEPISKAYVLKRQGMLYENVELYGHAIAKVAESEKLFGSVGHFQAKHLSKTYTRLHKKVLEIEYELSALEKKIKQVQFPANCLQQSSVISDADKKSLKINRKRLKRLRQRIGHEPALIRLGKKSPNT